MNTIEYNLSAPEGEHFQYCGRFSSFDAEVVSAFKDETDGTGNAICHRVSFSLFAQHITEILNGWMNKWKQNYEEEEWMLFTFYEMFSLLCGTICSVEDIYLEDFVQYYAEYEEYDVEHKHEINKDFFKTVREELLNREEERCDRIVECLHKIRQNFKLILSSEIYEEFLKDELVHEIFCDFFAVQASKLIDLLNNSLYNLKVGNANTNKSLGAAFDCDGFYEAQDFMEEAVRIGGEQVRIAEGEKVIIIENDIDVHAILNLFTTAWREDFGLSEKLFFWTAENSEGKTFIISSSDLENAYTTDALQKADVKILMEGLGKYIFVAEADIILPYVPATLQFKADIKRQELDFENSKQNEVDFVCILELSDGTLLYRGSIVKPGGKRRVIYLVNTLSVGEYQDSVFTIACVKDGEEIRNYRYNFTLEVV